MTRIHRGGFAIAAGLSLALLPPHPVAAAEGGPASMHEEDQVARTVVEDAGTKLEVAFDPVGLLLHVRYRVSNTGAAPLAVFDRGDQHAVLTGRLEAGGVPSPSWSAHEGGGTVLKHAARPMPRPERTLPPVPLAAKLEPGASLEGAFEFDMSLVEGPRRLRWCLGVMDFDEDAFVASDRGVDVAVWSAPTIAAELQRLVCTPWFDAAAGVFEEG